MDDVLVIGGGVIGLSLALDLAKHGCTVHVIDQGQPGREASWAGAGILPAATFAAWQHPYEQLRGLACELHPQWAAELRGRTGIDTGYRRCGGLHLARTPGEAAALSGWAGLMREEGIEVERLSPADLREIEPGLRTKSIATAFHVPGEAQLRNPWHLDALIRACELGGVKITSHAAVTDVVAQRDQCDRIQTSLGPLEAKQYCFTAGAWTGQILSRLGFST